MIYLMSEVYDHLMQNHTMVDFVDSFPESWIDEEEGEIYLAKKSGVALFKIKMEVMK